MAASSGITDAGHASMLDAYLASGDHIAWSANGTSETGSVARTAIVGWTAATAANPSVKAGPSSGVGALQSAAASAGVTVTHWCVYSVSTAGTQKTKWTALDTQVVLISGAKIDIAVNALKVQLAPIS